MEQLHWMADYDPVKIEQYLRLPLWDYWMILDNRMEQFEKQKQKDRIRPKVDSFGRVSKT